MFSGTAVSGEVMIVWSDPALRRICSSVAEACCKWQGSAAESSRWELARIGRAGVSVILVGKMTEMNDCVVSLGQDPPARQSLESTFEARVPCLKELAIEKRTLLHNFRGG